MKKIIFISLLILLFPFSGHAETRYVSGVLKITLRTGPSIEHKVIASIETGQQLEILYSEDDWTQVRLANGKEGWVMSRFLTDKKPFSVAFEQTKEKYEQISLQLAKLSEENEKYKKTNEWLESELDKSKKRLKELKSSYEILKKESSEFLNLKADYKKSVTDLTEQIKKAKQMEAELSQMRLQKNIKWFLSGAGVLVVGFLMGISAKRQRRKSSLL